MINKNLRLNCVQVIDRCLPSHSPIKTNFFKTAIQPKFNLKTKAGQESFKEAIREEIRKNIVVVPEKKSVLLLRLTRHFKKAGIGYKWISNSSVMTTGILFPKVIFMTFSNDNYCRVQPFQKNHSYNFCVDYDSCVLIAKMIKHRIILPQHIPATLL